MFPLFAELFETFSRARKSFLVLINTEGEWVEEEGVKVGLKEPLQMSMGYIATSSSSSSSSSSSQKSPPCSPSGGFKLPLQKSTDIAATSGTALQALLENEDFNWVRELLLF